jgi:hypothetical protein
MVLDHSDVLIVPPEKCLDVRPGREKDLPSYRCALAFHLALDGFTS